VRRGRDHPHRDQGARSRGQKWREDYSELDEVRVIVFFCDGKLLKIEPDWLLDTNETLYSVVSFEKSETSVLGGYGVPAMMRDPERACAPPGACCSTMPA
jgi:hypothetical protein